MTGKYRTIVIDPPWKISLSGKWKKVNQGLKDMPYQTMTDKEIMNFPIDDFAHKDCNLYLWTTNGKLPLAFQVLKDWGFRYHATFAWVKKNGPVVLGVHYVTEFCLFGYRGKFELTTLSDSVPTTFYAGHSQKPPAFYQYLLKKTKPPRIDIFSRKAHIGFEQYGDQACTPPHDLHTYF